MTDDSPRGLPLAEAFQAYSDPDDLRAFADWVNGGGSTFTEPGTPPAEWRVLGKFRELLRSGKLVATGFLVPVNPAAPVRQTIPPELWEILELDYDTSSAKAGGRKFVAIRVSRASEHERNSETGATETSETDSVPRAPGRPSYMYLIEPELRRRAETGEMRDQLTAECKHLEGWFRSEHPSLPAPLHGTIRKNLGVLYRELAARKTDPK